MIKFFTPKPEVEILQKKYKKLMAKGHKLSTVNRTESDKVYAEAHEILEQISQIE